MGDRERRDGGGERERLREKRVTECYDCSFGFVSMSVYVNMYICVYIYTNIYICIYVHIYMHIYTYKYIYIHIYIYMCVYVLHHEYV